MIGNFFIWCAGSDTTVLSNCEKSVRTKHVGLGTMVLIPAVMGSISMSYALSTLDQAGQNPYVFLSGGLLWGLIIFAFDRFIVSTHKKQLANIDEFKSFTFYLRIIFAFVLGIVVSHPFVLLYFKGSIHKQILEDKIVEFRGADSVYMAKYSDLLIGINTLKKSRACWENLLTAEQSGGPQVTTPCGTSSGRSGDGFRVTNIKTFIAGYDADIAKEQTRIDIEAAKLADSKGQAKNIIDKNTSFDYLSQEIALDELSVKYSIVRVSQFFIMLAFMLVDILPLIFKTFAPFSMYDKILVDDSDILEEIDIEKRRVFLQGAYGRIIDIYSATIGLYEKFDYKKYLELLSKRFALSQNIFMGICIGGLITLYLYYQGNPDLSNKEFWTIGTFFGLLTGVLGNLLTDVLKLATKYLKRTP